MSNPIDKESLGRVKRLLDQDLKIDAIKVYRDATGATVADAEQALGALEGADPPGPAGTPPPPSGGWLPDVCPNCGAGLNNNLVMWMDAGAAQCPHCGNTLHPPR